MHIERKFSINRSPSGMHNVLRIRSPTNEQYFKVPERDSPSMTKKAVVKQQQRKKEKDIILHHLDKAVNNLKMETKQSTLFEIMEKNQTPSLNEILKFENEYKSHIRSVIE
jgi:mevalonate kinase